MNNLGVALRAQRKTAEALAAFESAARLNPRAEVARKNLFANTRQYLRNPFLWVATVGLLLLVTAWDAGNPLGDAILVALVLVVAGILVVQRRRRKARLGTATRTFYDVENRKERMRNTIQVATVSIPIALALVLGLLLNSVALLFVLLIGGGTVWALGVRFFWKSHVLPWLAQRGF